MSKLISTATNLLLVSTIAISFYKCYWLLLEFFGCYYYYLPSISELFWSDSPLDKNVQINLSSRKLIQPVKIRSTN